MRRYKLCISLMVASLAFTGLAWAADEVAASDPVAEVNGRKISREKYDSRMKQMAAPNSEADQLAEMGLEVLRDLVREELLVQLAEQEKCAPTDAQMSERYADMLKDPSFGARLKASGLTEAQVKDTVRVLQAHFNLLTRGITVSPKEVIDFYNGNKETEFTVPENVNVAAIFCKDKADSDKAMALLRKGVEFGEVAKQLSSDPVSKERGGRLALPIYSEDPTLPKNVWKKLLTMRDGEYTEPITEQTTGAVIFKVIAHNPKKVVRLGEVRFRIWDSLMRVKGGAKWNIHEDLDKFREKSEIKVMIDRYKDKLFPTATNSSPATPG